MQAALSGEEGREGSDVENPKGLKQSLLTSTTSKDASSWSQRTAESVVDVWRKASQWLDLMLSIIVAMSIVGFVTWLILFYRSGDAPSGVVTTLWDSLVTLWAPREFVIKMVYTTPMTDERKQVFEDAKLFWGRIFSHGFDNRVRVAKDTPLCGIERMEEDLVVQDIVVFVSLQDIDGKGGILGQAGPCAYDSRGRIRAGLMRFDISDLDNHFAETVQHEMGHVFGLGSAWEEKRLLSITENDGIAYQGQFGNQGHREIGGHGNHAIVEDSGGAGTAGSHWKESVYPGEIMTGYLKKGSPHLISRLTVRALQDLGFSVDPDKADPYFIPGSGDVPSFRRRLRAVALPRQQVDVERPVGEELSMENDIYQTGRVEVLQTI